MGKQVNMIIFLILLELLVPPAHGYRYAVTQLIPDLIVVHALLLEVCEQLRQTALANGRIVAEHGVDALSELALLFLLQHFLRILIDRAIRQVAEHIQGSTVKSTTE